MKECHPTNASANSVTSGAVWSPEPAVIARSLALPAGDASKAAKVRRPPNAFIIYRKDWHSRVLPACAAFLEGHRQRLAPPAGDASVKDLRLRVRRPPDAFIIYRKDWRSRVVAEDPGLHNNAISVIIGDR